MNLVPHTDPGDPAGSRLGFVVTARTHLISDTHFNHTKLAEVYEAPARMSLGADHNVVMVARWQQAVGDDDVVIHLGDLALGKPDDFARIAQQLPGRKYMLNTGNHDRRSRAWYAQHGFTLIPEFWLEHRGWKVRFTHRPDDERRHVAYPRHINAHGHVHSQTREDRRLINVSVEAIDFRPVPLLATLDARIDELEGR